MKVFLVSWYVFTISYQNVTTSVMGSVTMLKPVLTAISPGSSPILDKARNRDPSALRICISSWQSVSGASPSGSVTLKSISIVFPAIILISTSAGSTLNTFILVGIIQVKITIVIMAIAAITATNRIQGSLLLRLTAGTGAGTGSGLVAARLILNSSVLLFIILGLINITNQRLRCLLCHQIRPHTRQDYTAGKFLSEPRSPLLAPRQLNEFPPNEAR